MPPNQRMKLTACGRRVRRKAQWRLSILIAASAGAAYARFVRRQPLYQPTPHAGHDSMKAYLITTGSLFGLLALVHLWRIIGEWPRLVTDPWQSLEAIIGIAAAALCLWAWRLLRRSART